MVAAVSHLQVAFAACSMDVMVESVDGGNKAVVSVDTKVYGGNKAVASADTKVDGEMSLQSNRYMGN